MSEQLNKEKHIVEVIHKTFKTADATVTRKSRISVKLRSDLLPPLVSYLKSYLNFNHLVMISCADWIEENQFELGYHLYSYESKIQVIIKVRIDRTEPKMQTIIPFWEHAGTYEREIHEMYGIHIEGHPDLSEFILEDWDEIPPMRRDFNTREYVEDVYEWREGREDKQDVRDTISKRFGEIVPEFNKEQKN